MGAAIRGPERAEWALNRRKSRRVRGSAKRSNASRRGRGAGDRFRAMSGDDEAVPGNSAVPGNEAVRETEAVPGNQAVPETGATNRANGPSHEPGGRKGGAIAAAPVWRYQFRTR